MAATAPFCLRPWLPRPLLRVAAVPGFRRSRRRWRHPRVPLPPTTDPWLGRAGAADVGDSPPSAPHSKPRWLCGLCTTRTRPRSRLIETVFGVGSSSVGTGSKGLPFNVVVWDGPHVPDNAHLLQWSFFGSPREVSEASFPKLSVHLPRCTLLCAMSTARWLQTVVTRTHDPCVPDGKGASASSSVLLAIVAGKETQDHGQSRRSGG